MKLIISDEPKFKRLTRNPTKARENSSIIYLRKLKHDGVIDEVTLREIMPSGSRPGILCGLLEVHKPGCPFRPIVSTVKT